MKGFLLTIGAVVAAGTFGGQAEAKIPLLSANCPGGFSVFAEKGGPVFINGQEAKLKTFNENYYEAAGGGITVSISVRPDGSPDVSYTGKHGANGVCQQLPPPSDDNG